MSAESISSVQVGARFGNGFGSGRAVQPQHFSPFRLMGAGILGYALACATLWGYQRHLIFEPDRSMHARPSDYRFPVEDIVVPVSGPSGPASAVRTLHGWWIPSSHSGAKTVLYLHGNDGNVSTSIDAVAPLRELGYAVMLIDYRGYGQSDDEFPSEEGVYDDAEAAWRYLARERRENPADVYIYGHSLGSAIAIELALRHPEAAGLIVESGFTSIQDMAALEKQYSLFPVDLFLNQRFESIQKVGGLRTPALFIHGTADEVVPYAMGERLYNAAGGNKRFVPIESGRHENNAVAGGATLRAAISSFVAETQGKHSAQMLAGR